jgi:hypothetical protein
MGIREDLQAAAKLVRDGGLRYQPSSCTCPFRPRELHTPCHYPACQQKDDKTP